MGPGAAAPPGQRLLGSQNRAAVQAARVLRAGRVCSGRERSRRRGRQGGVWSSPARTGCWTPLQCRLTSFIATTFTASTSDPRILCPSWDPSVLPVVLDFATTRGCWAAAAPTRSTAIAGAKAAAPARGPTSTPAAFARARRTTGEGRRAIMAASRVHDTSRRHREPDGPRSETLW